MSDITMLDAPAATEAPESRIGIDCPECVGSGGWYRYEPALEHAVGTRYLSCMQCRGSGRTALPRG